MHGRRHRARVGCLLLAVLGVAGFFRVHDLAQRNPVALFLSEEGRAEYEAFREEFSERPVILGRVRSEDSALRSTTLGEVTRIAKEHACDILAASSLPAGDSSAPVGPFRLRGVDYDAFVITAPFDSAADELHALIDQLRGLEPSDDQPANEASDPGLHIDLAGVAVTNRELDRASAVIGQRLFPATFGLGLVLVLLLTRSLRSTLSIYPPALLATAATLVGLQLGFGSMDMVTSIVPLLAFVLNLSLAFHLTGAIDATGSFRRAWVEKSRPILLMVLTTAVGFGALALSEIPAIRRFGIAAAIAVTFTAVLTTLWVHLGSIAFPRTERSPDGRATEGPASTPNAFGIRALAWRAPRWVVFVGIVGGLIAGGYGLTALKVETDALEFFPESSGFATRVRALQSDVAGTPVVEILATAPGDEARTIPESAQEHLRTLDRLERSIADRFSGDVRTLSRASLLRTVASRVLGRDEVPNSTVVATTLWKLLPETLQAAYGPHDRERITVFSGNRDAEHHRAQLRELEETLSNAAPGWTFEFAGLYHRLLLSQDELISALVASLTTSAIVISALFWWSCRRWPWLVVFWITNLVPIVAGFGLASALGCSLNVATVMVASIALGVIVDSTLHLVHAFERERVSSHEANHAWGTGHDRVSTRILVRGTLLPVAASGAILVPCFLLFSTFDFGPIREFGVTLGLTLLFAYSFNLYALPVLIGADPASNDLERSESRESEAVPAESVLGSTQPKGVRPDPS